MFRRSEKGFTLVELMIVVVIIGILASIAIPKFSSLIGKTKTTEAKQMLGQIVQLEKTYYFTNNAYEDFAYLADCPAIGFAAPDGARFKYKFETDTATALEDDTTTSGDVNGDGDYLDGLTLSVDNVRGVLGDITW